MPDNASSTTAQSVYCQRKEAHREGVYQKALVTLTQQVCLNVWVITWSLAYLNTGVAHVDLSVPSNASNPEFKGVPNSSSNPNAASVPKTPSNPVAVSAF